jgi:hypothetical protein
MQCMARTLRSSTMTCPMSLPTAMKSLTEKPNGTAMSLVLTVKLKRTMRTEGLDFSRLAFLPASLRGAGPGCTCHGIPGQLGHSPIEDENALGLHTARLFMVWPSAATKHLCSSLPAAVRCGRVFGDNEEGVVEAPTPNSVYI